VLEISMSGRSKQPRLILKNLAQRPVRNGILIVCVAAVIAMQVGAALLERASVRGLEQGLARLGADLLVVPRGFEDVMFESLVTGEAGLFYIDSDYEKRLVALDFVESVAPQLYVESLSGASCCSVWNVFLIGFDPARDFTVRPWIEGEPDLSHGTKGIFVGREMGVSKGDKMKFYGTEFVVAGVLSHSGMGLDTTVFIPLEGVYQMAENSPIMAEKRLEVDRDMISALLVNLKSRKNGGIESARAAYRIEKNFAELGVIMPDELLTKVQNNLRGTLDGLRTVSYIIWPVAALLVGLVFTMATTERRREIGLLRAMGATRAFIFRLIVNEAMIIAVLGTICGLAVSTWLTAGFSKLVAMSLKIPFLMPDFYSIGLLFVQAAILALATGVVASLYPAIFAARMEPYEAIRRGEQ
jgi:putative ABC transport system permease protein